MSLRIRRGTEAQRLQHVFDQGEIVYTTDTGKVFIGNGQTAGGNHILKNSVGVGFTFNDTTQSIDFSVPSLNLSTSDVSEDPSRKYFTDLRAIDAVGTALAEGPNTGIAFTYNAQAGTISAQVTSGIDALLPSQVGNEGKWLTTDGENASWATAPLGGLQFPSPVGHQSQFLTTADGATLSWATPTTANLVNGAYSVQLGSNGKTTFQGDLLLGSAVDIKRDVGGGLYSSVLGGLNTVSQDPSPALGGNLSLNTHTISGVGSINITGGITASTSVSGNTLSATLGISGNSVTSTTSVTGATLNTATLSVTGATLTTTEAPDIQTLRSDNAIYAGTASSPATVWVNSSRNFIYGTGLTDGLQTGGISTRISRGTLSAPTALQAADAVTYLEGFAYSDTDYVNVGAFGLFIDETYDGTPGSNEQLPGTFGALTINKNGTPNFLKFNSDGVLNAPIFKATSYDSTAITGLNPEPGWIIYDSTNNQFKGWNGSSWSVLG